MDKEEYQNSVQFKELLSLIDKALTDTAAFRNKTDLSPEEISILAEWSDKIMKSMRSLYLYVKNDYLMEYNKKKKVTIDPSKNNDQVKIELYDNETEGTEKDQYSRIYAYSFGPFDTNYYFCEDTFQILWLLKEPLLCNSKEIKERNQGVDQAYQYRTWESIVKEYKEEGPKTKYNLIKRSQTILKEIAKLDIRKIQDPKLKAQLCKLKEENLNIEDNVMKHLCILEVNHFPGLAFASTDSDDGIIKNWAYLNDNLIEKLINFYAPVVVIGGYTLEYFFSSTKSNKNRSFIPEETCIAFDNKTLKIFNDLIKDWTYINAGGRYEECLPKDEEVIRPSLVINALKHPDDTNYMLKFSFGRNAKYLGESGRIYIQAYHPCKDSNYPSKWAEKDGKRIYQWLKEYNKLPKS